MLITPFPRSTLVRPQHICSPMFKSICEEAYTKVEPDIKKCLTPTRCKENVCQYFFLNYTLFKGRGSNKGIPRKHLSLKVYSAEQVAAYLDDPHHKGLIACINDVEMPQEKFESSRTVIISAFERLFPAKSKFEKQVPTGTHKKAPALAPGLFCRKGQKECP